MIIDNKEAKQELLYTAYGLSVYGIISDYVWTYDGSGRMEKCITSISIKNSDNTELCNRYLGNNCIFMNVFNKHIDNILWYLNHESIDSWQIDHEIIQNILIKNGSILSYQIEQRRQKEKQEAEQNRLNAELEAIENKKKESIQNYCNKKKLYCRFIYNDLYVFKINKDTDKVIKLLNNADSKSMDSYVDYATKYPDHELTVIYVGSGYKGIDIMLTELKEVA